MVAKYRRKMVIRAPSVPEDQSDDSIASRESNRTSSPAGSRQSSQMEEESADEGNESPLRQSEGLDADKFHSAQGFQFPLMAVKKMLVDAKICENISLKSVIYTAAIIEYLVEELLMCAIENTQSEKSLNIYPRNILGGIVKDNGFFHWLRLKGVVVATEKGSYFKRIFQPIRVETLLYDAKGQWTGYKP